MESASEINSSPPQALLQNMGGVKWAMSETGGIPPAPRCRSRLSLTLAEREEISRAMVAGQSVRSIAASLRRAEDDMLNKAKLRAKMPAGFWSQDSDFYMEPMARYIETGLNKELVSRKGACWFADKQ